MTFEEAYERHSRFIRARAWMQHVPGLDYEEVVSEMMASLWKATRTYREELGTFESYWWSIWLNDRSKMTRAAYAQKRPVIIVAGDDLESGHYMPQVFPDPPTQADGTARKVWTMIAHGVPVKDIVSQTGISVRRYYSLLRQWQTDDVRSSLYD